MRLTDESGGPEACHEWTGSRNADGYGRFRVGGETVLAHRWIVAAPTGTVVWHRCDNPPCVNPAHLVVGTQGDNVRDMVEKGRLNPWQRHKTHCKHGHPFDEENTYIESGRRRCRACRCEAQRRYRARAQS